MVREAGGRALTHSAAHRRSDRARPREIRPRGIGRYGQTALARTQPRYSASFEQFPFFRDCDSAHGERSLHDGWRPLQLYAASAARNRRPYFALESAALFTELEGC